MNKPESRELRRARFICQNSSLIQPTLTKLMIATVTNEEAAPAGKLPPLLTPGHTFKTNGRHYIVMKTDDGDETIEVEVVRSIPTDLIDPHPKNRTWCDPVAQQELVENLREHGQSTPGILRPHPEKPGRFQLIAAWRRWNACKELGRPLQAMVRDLDDVQALEQLYLENAQRENLRPMDEAELIDGMLELRDAQQCRVFTIERVAMARYGTAKPGDVKRIAQLHKLLQLPEKLREAVNTGALSLAVAFLVARIADEGDRIKAGEQVMSDPFTSLPMTVKRAKELISSKYQVNLKGFAWMERTDLLTEEEKLAMGFTGAAGEAADGSCARCPLLAKNNPAFEGELATGTRKGKGESGIDPLTCTRACCHQMKLENEWRGRAVEFAKEHGVPAERVMSLAQSGDLDYVVLKEKPTGYQLGNWQLASNPKNPTWETILKGSGAPLMVAADNDDTPELVCETGLAVTVGKEKYPALFAGSPAGQTGGAVGLSPKDASALVAKRESGDLKEDEAKLLAEHEALVEKGRIEKLKGEMERAVAAETKTDCLKELMEKLTEKGPGLDGARAMVMSVTREHGTDFYAFLTGRSEDELDEEYGYDFEPLLVEHLKGKTINEMMAIAAVASVWEDVNFSGQDLAADFQAMCKAVKLDTEAVHARVKKAHLLAFKANELSRKKALKGEGRKVPKDSSNPTNWSADQEAEKSAAADEREHDTRIVLLEFCNAEELPDLIEALLNREVPVTVPNEHGSFVQRAVFSYTFDRKVGFSIELAHSCLEGVDAWHWSYHYKLGNRSGGGLPSLNVGMYPERREAVQQAAMALLKSFEDPADPKSCACSRVNALEMLQKIYDGCMLLGVEEKEVTEESLPALDDKGRVVEFESHSEDDEAALLDALLNRDIPTFKPGKDGIFMQRAVFTHVAMEGVGFASDLVKDVEGKWAAGHESSMGNGIDVGGFYPSAESLYNSRLDALRDALNDLYNDWSGYSPKKKHMGVWESTRALIARLQEDVAQAIVTAAEPEDAGREMAQPAAVLKAGGSIDLSGPDGEQERRSLVKGDEDKAVEPAYVDLDELDGQVVDYDKVDVAAAGEALKAGTGEMADFIGKKPHKQREEARFKAWDALRAKILRKAGLKK